VDYRLAWLEGNYDGPDSGLTDLAGPAAGGRFDFRPDASLGHLFEPGPLDLDQRHVLSAAGAVDLPRGFRVGWGVRCASGVPLTQLGTHPVYQVDGFVPLARRGAAGRQEWSGTADLRLEWCLALSDSGKKLVLGADLFNVLNRRSVTLSDTSRQCLFGTNPDYGLALSRSEPFTARLTARFEF